VRELKAVKSASFRIAKGKTLGVVGESGSGKTTVALLVARLHQATAGQVLFDGRNLLEGGSKNFLPYKRRIQIVFQNPYASLNPRFTVGQILTEPMQIHGIGADDAERRGRAAELLEKVGLPADSLEKYPHEFSGGQRQRIAIARALTLRPELLICDEAVSALDVSVQAQVINLLEDLQELLGLTYLVIAHDLAVVRHISDTVGVMYLGRLVEEAPSDDLYARPLHPYTIALMSAIPIPDPEVEDHRERILLRGDLPSPANPPSGCRFHTRCPYRQPTRCDTEVPELRVIPTLGEGRRVACHWAEEIAAGTVGVADPDLVVEPVR
jgi:peptide/nickel transport system ATP-binding protein